MIRSVRCHWPSSYVTQSPSASKLRAPTEHCQGLLMINRLALSLLLLTFHSPSSTADDRINDRETAREIVTNLNALIEDGKLERRNLTISVNKGNVTVTGRIEDAQESRLILESVITAREINGIDLILGIGREPASAGQPMPESERGRRLFRWDDGFWQLDFEAEPIRHRTK
ncbi:BON domain-containing protein [Roseiconus nitratireducens]|uniref:BON domain-containing protein n=1 Tax=Roseiconus nitratireducens TaxID=2605748 RepID=A0A5M6D036_9BACT|nr:BON domain-containing protein [Roseiconus nitratireducens]KAA5538505.1 BON domain-containing protein [Roseiconus nitratireducens]